MARKTKKIGIAYEWDLDEEPLTIFKECFQLTWKGDDSWMISIPNRNKQAFIAIRSRNSIPYREAEITAKTISLIPEMIQTLCAISEITALDCQTKKDLMETIFSCQNMSKRLLRLITNQMGAK